MFIKLGIYVFVLNTMMIHIKGGHAPGSFLVKGTGGQTLFSHVGLIL